MKRRFGILALVLAAALVVSPLARAQEETPGEEPGVEQPELQKEELLEEVDEAAADAGVEPEVILDAEIDTEITKPNGEKKQVKVSVGDAIDALAGESVLVEDGSGILGTPELGIGNLMHFFLDVEVFTKGVQVYNDSYPLGGTEPAPRESTFALPDASNYAHYDVKKSDYVPTTPLLPVINPLALAGGAAPLPPEAPALPPILALHYGGKLTSVVGSGWGDKAPETGVTRINSGSHCGGTALAGVCNNVDTRERETSDANPWPVYLPLLGEGSTTLEDDQIDFAGWGIVTQGASCTDGRVVRYTHINTTFVKRTIRTTIFVPMCTGFGLLLGDGAAIYEPAPVSFRAIPVIWDPAPEPVKQVITAVDEAIGSVPVGDTLGQVLGAGGEIPDPDDPLPSG